MRTTSSIRGSVIPPTRNSPSTTSERDGLSAAPSSQAPAENITPGGAPFWRDTNKDWANDASPEAKSSLELLIRWMEQPDNWGKFKAGVQNYNQKSASGEASKYLFAHLCATKRSQQACQGKLSKVYTGWSKALDWDMGTGQGDGGTLRRAAVEDGNLEEVEEDILAKCDKECGGPGMYERLTKIFKESGGGVEAARGDQRDGATASAVSAFEANEKEDEETSPSPPSVGGANDDEDEEVHPFVPRSAGSATAAPRQSSATIGRGSHVAGAGRNKDKRPADLIMTPVRDEHHGKRPRTENHLLARAEDWNKAETMRHQEAMKAKEESVAERANYHKEKLRLQAVEMEDKIRRENREMEDKIKRESRAERMVLAERIMTAEGHVPFDEAMRRAKALQEED